MKIAMLAAAGLLAACAANPKNIEPSYVSSSKYEGWGCDGLKREYWEIVPRLAAHEQAQQRRRTWDTWSGALIGITPTLLNPDNDREFEIAMLKGEVHAISAQAAVIGCVLDHRAAPPPPVAVGPTPAGVTSQPPAATPG